jgi:alpha-mannosidase
MIYSTEGHPLQGITGGYDSLRRVEFILKDTNYAQTYHIEVSANGL